MHMLNPPEIQQNQNTLNSFPMPDYKMATSHSSPLLYSMRFLETIILVHSVLTLFNLRKENNNVYYVKYCNITTSLEMLILLYVGS